MAFFNIYPEASGRAGLSLPIIHYKNQYMKFVKTLAFTFVLGQLSASGQSFVDVGYSLGTPRQDMNKNINLLHSLSSGIRFTIPGTRGHLQLGAEGAWGSYAVTSKEQTFRFRDGSSTRTMVNYSSNVLQGALNARWMLLHNKGINPYISAKGGYASFYSTIFIEDPHDIDGCRPLDQKTLLKDGTLFGGYGGGLQVDWSVFSRSAGKRSGYIDFRVQQIRGNTVSYINTKRLYDADNPPTGGDGKAVNVQFINATTNEIHEHQVAEVYSTPLRMMEFRLSWVWVLD